MELKSFKQLLLKKAEDNSYLQTLIEYAKDEIIAERVIESLIKMAEPSAAMGRDANSAITAYAGQMDKSDVEQLRDALGHHISHYRGALKTHQTATDPKVKDSARKAADAHLSKIVPLMHLAGRAGRHSNGKMVLDYPSTIPWETNYTRTDRFDQNGEHKDPDITLPSGESVPGKSYKGSPGKLVEGTKDLRRRPKQVREGSKRGVSNYRYLEMPPHPGHADSKRIPHKGGYPFEEVQLGNPSDRDTGKAYLPIEDVDNVTQYTPHPFDNHPVHEHEYKQDKFLEAPHREKFAQDLAAWKSSPHHKKWFEDHKAKFQKDPEAYKARGKSKPKHVFEGLQLHEAPDHAREASQEAPKQEAAPGKPAAPAAASEAKAKKVEIDPEDLKHLPPALRKKYGLE